MKFQEYEKMKKVFLLILSLLVLIMFAACSGIQDGIRPYSSLAHVGGPVEISAATFPDSNFRKLISGPSYDRNQDGFLDDEEIIYIRNIWCANCDITSLKGIEYLVELRGLYCMDNHIKTLDLSNNKEITGVWCSGNDFTSLDFSPNKKLLWVYCFDCKLTSLNVSNNPELAYLECNTNPLEYLDVSHNPELEHLTCGSCWLKTLDVSKNPKLQHLDAFRNKFTTLDITKCPLMKRLDIWDNPGLGSVDISKCPGLQYYNCANNTVSELDLSTCPKLQRLSCGYNQIKHLDLSNNPELVYLDCGQNELEELDVSNNPKLKFLQAFINPFTEIDVSNNYSLVRAYREAEMTPAPNVSGCYWKIDFGGDTSTGVDNCFFLCVDDEVDVTANGNTSAPKPAVTSPAGVTTSELMDREEVVNALYELAGSPNPDSLSSTRFSDITSGSSSALIWAMNRGILVDCTDYTFDKNSLCSREDAVCMLMRYAEYRGYERAIDFGRTDPFIDYYDIDEYAWEALTWAVTWNIVIGHGEEGAPKEERTLDPHDAVIRAEFREMIDRMLEKNS